MNRILKHLSKHRQQANGAANFFDGIEDPKPLPEPAPFDIGVFGDQAVVEPRAPTDKYPGTSETCSYCGKPSNDSIFNAVSQYKPFAVMCDECMEKFASLVKMVRLFRMYADPSPSWDGVRRQIEKALAGEVGSPQAKLAAANIALLLAKRTCGAMGMRHEKRDASGYCEKLGISLESRRIAIVGKGAKQTVSLVKAAMGAVGIPVQEASGQEVAANPSSGAAIMALFKKCGHEQYFFENSLLIATDGHVPLDIACSVLYVCETEEGLPEWVTAYKI